MRNRNKHFSDNNSLAKVDQLKLICKQKDISITSYVILWLLFYKRVNAVLTGPRTCVQFLELMDHILYMRRFGLQTNKPCDDFNTSYLFNTI